MKPGYRASGCSFHGAEEGALLAEDASELAAHAGVAPPTASGHLSKLIATGLVVMQRQGRRRYHSLASPEVAGMLESMSQMAASGSRAGGGRPVHVGPGDAALRAARTCYDHLAGRLAVGLCEAMAHHGHIEIDRDGGVVTPSGAGFLQELGIDLAAAAQSKRTFCRTCLDWSERRPHLAGAVGAALLRRCFELHWVRRRGRLSEGVRRGHPFRNGWLAPRSGAGAAERRS